jgi:menaquinone-9 beta-reductase
MEKTMIGDDQLWDATIIGAGPAGSAAAIELSRNNKVLLVDKSVFPRHKVCGCCLNGRALRTLEELGIVGAIFDGSNALSDLSIYYQHRTVSLPLSGGRAVSRSLLDQTLVQAAIDLGADFMQGTAARIEKIDDDFVRVNLSNNNGQARSIRSKTVICADGLNSTALRNIPGFTANAESNSRIGAGTILSNGSPFYEPGRIYMCCAREGYVGLVRVESGQLDVAAAFDAEYLKSGGGPAKAARRIIEQNGLPSEEIGDAEWQGTIALTRRRSKISTHRIFVVGDAASYAEPFTGEGISWALSSGRQAAILANEGIVSWSRNIEQRWSNWHSQSVVKRQHLSLLIAHLLRHPHLTSLAAGILDRAPLLSRPLIRYINA